MQARDSLEGTINQQQCATDQPLQERLDHDHLNKSAAQKVFRQAFVTDQIPAMLDSWVSELRVNQEGVGIMKRNLCCNNKEEGTHLDDNKRTITKRLKSAHQHTGPRNVALSQQFKKKVDLIEKKEIPMVEECQTKQRQSIGSLGKFRYVLNSFNSTWSNNNGGVNTPSRTHIQSTKPSENHI